MSSWEIGMSKRGGALAPHAILQSVSAAAIGNGLSLSTVFRMQNAEPAQGDLGVLEISRNLRFFGTKYPRAVISQRSH